MDESPPVTHADLDRVVSRIVDAFTANLSDLRNEMISRFEKVDERFDAVLRRLDRIETNVTATQMQTMGMSKSLTDAERLDTAMLGTQFAQQRAIDDLAARVTQIERRLAGQQ